MNGEADSLSGAATSQEPRRLPLCDAEGAVVAYALVDAEDHARFCGHRWSLKRDSTGRAYAVRAEAREASRRGRPTKVYLHREVVGLPPRDRRHVDHISRDTLDDRKVNLRLCTHAQNRQNTSGWRNASSRFRGVSYDKARGKWKAQAMLAGKNRLIGRYDTEQEAATAARDWRAEHMPFATD